ncbi:dienelactone hydrolase family protein [Henriciella aquimarina]|uniref:dienelactone hydrolase family protein n=1 Tax=Henriciella aquimarina TaxID=545261 RepID=UPI000A046268|nr:dienelactone hydrolase family protein [Henriciella aquimarina]
MAISTKSLEYEAGGQTYEGFLAMPEGKPKAVVVIVHAWGGQGEFDHEKAKLMAEWGYAGFAVDVFGKGKRGETKEECQALIEPLVSNREELQNRLKLSLEAARTESGCDKAAAIGFCFGGLCVLDMARTSMEVQGVASFHGLLGAPGNTDGKSTNVKTLVLHGWDDPMAKPEDVMAFTKEMDAAGADWQLHAYGGTMHAFTNPNANDPDFGTVYNPDAERRSLAALKDFLGELYS